MNISREHSKFLWITSAIFRSPAKLVRKDAWNSQNSYKLFWKSCGYHHNRYENQPGTFKVLMDYIGNLMVTITNDLKISLGHVQFLWIILAIFRSPTKSVFIVEILWSPSQPI